MPPNEFLNVAAATVAAAALLAYVSLVVVSLVQVIRSRSLATLERAAWVLAIVLFPLFGTIVWFLWGDKTRSVMDRLGFRRRL